LGQINNKTTCGWTKQIEKCVNGWGKQWRKRVIFFLNSTQINVQACLRHVRFENARVILCMLHVLLGPQNTLNIFEFLGTTFFLFFLFLTFLF
jgi:hypothetical protein